MTRHNGVHPGSVALSPRANAAQRHTARRQPSDQTSDKARFATRSRAHDHHPDPLVVARHQSRL